jgi:hypothetical protein
MTFASCHPPAPHDGVVIQGCKRSAPEESRGQEHDHVQCVPRQLLAVTFAKVKPLPPGLMRSRNGSLLLEAVIRATLDS